MSTDIRDLLVNPITEASLTEEVGRVADNLKDLKDEFSRKREREEAVVANTNALRKEFHVVQYNRNPLYRNTRDTYLDFVGTEKSPSEVLTELGGNVVGMTERVDGITWTIEKVVPIKRANTSNE